MKYIIDLSDNFKKEKHGFYAGTFLLKKENKDNINIEEAIKANAKNIADFLRCMNGFWAFCIKLDDELIISVDHIRSIPLFYGIYNNQLYISDIAENVRKFCCETEMLPFAQKQILYYNCTTTNTTLFQSVKQAQPGELIKFYLKKNKIELSKEKWFSFTNTALKAPIDEYFYYKQLEHVSQESFKRLIEYANGRTIVIPLSGGYDSRLVLLELIKQGYTNIITFTYGKKNNTEAVISQKIANELNTRWIFIEYTQKTILKYKINNQIDKYEKYSHNYCSLPHMQDFYAVMEMKERKLIPHDSVFVPGHTDLVFGSLIIKDGIDCTKSTYTVEEIFKKAFSLYQFPICGMSNIDVINYSTGYKFDAKNSFDIDTAASMIEQFYFENRVNKFVNNSIRVYEFAGYDWWLPLQDSEYLDFWSKVPLGLRKNRKLNIAYLGSEYSKHTGIAVQNAIKRNENSKKYTFFQKLGRQLPKRIQLFIKRIKSIYLLFNSQRGYLYVPYAWRDIFAIVFHKKLPTKLNTIEARSVLKQNRSMSRKLSVQPHKTI